MPNYTENYNLKKPLSNEYYSIEDQNDNMDIIDQQLKANADEINAHKAETATIKSDIVVTVGSSGDFQSINAALESLYTRYPQYKQNGITVEIKLLSGFVMQEQVLVKGIDLGWIVITSEDAEVTIDRSALTEPIALGELSGEPQAYPAFGGRDGAVLPEIAVLFNMNNSGDGELRHGLYLRRQSKARLHLGAGFKNCGGDGIAIEFGSHLEGRAFIVSGAGRDGISVRHSSVLQCREIDTLIVDATNAGRYGAIIEQMSRAHLRDIDVSGAGQDGIFVASSEVDLRAGKANNCVRNGLNITRGSIVRCSVGFEAKNAGFIGAQVAQASTLLAPSSDFSGAVQHAVRVSDNSVACFDNSNLSGAGNRGVSCFSSRVSVAGANISGASTYGIDASQGSHVNAQDANCQMGVAPAETDIKVSTGSIINANGAIGGTSQTPNQITSAGIIFK